MMGNDTAIASLKEKIDGLNQLAWDVRVNDSPKALQLSEESVKLARSIDYTKGLAEGLRSLGFANVRLFKNEEAAPLLRESLALFQSLNDLLGQGIVYEYLGIIERNWGNLGTSLELLLKGHALIVQVGSVEIETTSCYQIGVTYKHLGNHESALDYLYKALSVAKSSGNNLMVAYATNIIGSIYFDNGDYKHALDCYQQGLVIRRESNDKWGEAGSLDNIGFTYLKLKDLDKAIDYCTQSLTICQSTGDKKGESNALLHLAEIYEQAGDIMQASTFSNRSLEIRKARGDRRGEAEALLFHADLHKNRKDTEDDQIFGWLSGALNIAEEIKAQDLSSKAYYNLYEYYTGKGNFKESLTHLEAHLKIEKELHKNTIIQKVSNLEISHKAETISKRNKELTELNEKIEKANNELRVEAALEKVRAVAMAMRRGDDLMLISEVIYKQLSVLGFSNVRNVQIAIDDDEKQLYNGVEYSEYYQNRLVEVPYDSSPMFREIVNELKRSDNAFYQKEIKGKDFEDWRTWRMNIDTKNHPDIVSATSMCFYLHSVGAGMLGISTFNAITNDQLEILKRLRNVFELSYKRYIDIEKAEAQAREAQIEAGLERVRSKTMAMHKSEEVTGIAVSLNEELLKLGFEGGSTIIIIDKETGDTEQWTGFSEDRSLRSCYVPNFNHPFHDALLNAWKNNEKFLVYTVAGDEKRSLDDHYFSTGYKIFPENDKKWMRAMASVTFSHAFMKYGAIHWGPEHLTEEQLNILQRFAKVFEQSYTRFLDLQKAEAQAREAQIEAALEKVRSRSLAMHHSNEIKEVVKTVFEKMKELGFFQNNSVMIVLPKNEFRDVVHWTFNENFETTEYYIPAFDHQVSIDALKAWKNGEKTFEIQLDKREKNKFLDLIFSETDYSKVPDNFKQYLYSTEAYSQFFTFEKHCGLLVDTFTTFVYSQNQKDIVIRFAKVFEQAYIRFLDLQKAEAQAKEAQIEAGLERVRSRAMAMQNSEELNALIGTVFTELTKLDLVLIRCVIFIYEGNENGVRWWMANSEAPSTPVNCFVKYIDLPVYNSYLKGWKERSLKWQYILEGQEKLMSDEFAFKETELSQLPDIVIAGMRDPDRVFLSASFNNFGCLTLASLEPLSDEHIEILIRFAKVFDLTYTRFNDLKQAEAQAREAEIELALERVRARAMAMQKPTEFVEVVNVMGEQFINLDFDIEWANFGANGFDVAEGIDTWNFAVIPGGDPISSRLFIPYFEHPLFTDAKKQLDEYRRTGSDFFEMTYDKGVKDQWLDHLFTKTFFKDVPKEYQDIQYAKQGYTTSNLVLKDTWLSIGKFDTRSFTDEQHSILKRFGKAFGQAYTRFRDLQKVEAQAREAKIEAALEKVRSRTMGMQKSDELQSAALLLFQQVQALGAKYFACGFNIWDEDKKAATAWMAREDAILPPFKTSSSEDVFLKILEAAKQGESLFVREQGGEELEIHYSYMASIPLFRTMMEEMKQVGLSVPTFQIIHCAFFAQGYLMFISFEPVPEAHDIFKRFAKVFEQTYTRFLDLQKAEAQAREVEIELALERVRARTMAMQKSEELQEVVHTVFERLKELNIDFYTAIIILFEEGSKDIVWWLESKAYHQYQKIIVPYAEFPYLQDLFSARENKIEFFSKTYSFEEKNHLFHHLFANTNLKLVPQQQKDFLLGTEFATMSVSLSKNIGLHITSYSRRSFSEQDNDVFKRFAKVFDQAYTRFLDLQKAEAQAREALIEAALERVRARALAMQEPEELKEVAQVLRTEMGLLGVEELETCSIYIHEKDSETAECWYALKDPKETEKKMVADHFHLALNDTWVGREMKKFYSSDEKQTSIVMQGANRKEWIAYCYKHSPVFSGFYGETIPDRTYHLYKFSHGYIGAAAPGDISAESWRLLKRAASVFSLAYSRFRDLTQARNDLIKLKEEKKRAEDALTELQATQKQLIQSEKMASLGELTAGIAHEIQNPLNFVNNFSDVSNELLDEMKQELATGNTQQAIEIVKDVKENLEKILHHGKRADSIVKGMLQHSRSTSGQKEPTDINNLAEEYLRLSYHGLRAKDKFFNAKFETDLDTSLGKINIVPQEIGRVILNLVNNSFYAVNEKKKNTGNGYEPLITVSTKKIKDKVEIRVKDNGNGIPQKDLDKIFQPFFTTKPTGQGTGLGLSLSYDIITKGHDGDIRVETKEGEGSKFIISLPVK